MNQPPHPPSPYPAAGSYGPFGPPVSSPERVRLAWQARHQSDYVFAFWTALGWTLLTCGIYGIYVVYQLMRRDRDHNLRRLELLDAANAVAWEQAHRRGLAEELRPAFERVAAHLGTLRGQTTEFRDPGLWALIAFVAGQIGTIIVYVLVDGDLVRHDHAEGAIEAELAEIYTRLGAPLAAPDAARLKERHNLGGRIAALVFTCGIYGIWWMYDVMVEGNRHFEHNWRWEDGLATSVQSLAA